MKKRLILAALLGSLATAAAHAQPFAIDWFTIDGGGGVSSGGGFSLSGTIGQWDAGPTMTGGDFALTGGFWALPIAVPTPESPELRIMPAAAGQATISWSPGGPGFVLQVSDDGYAWS